MKWVLFMLGFYLLGFMAFAAFCLSGCWLAHMVAYMLPPVPLHPLLNYMFLALDSVFPLFGVAAFAIFCLYLMTAAMKGNFMLGLNFLVIKLYPMRPGATMMSSFLVNTGLILVMSPAIVQFCAQVARVWTVSLVLPAGLSFSNALYAIYNPCLLPLTPACYCHPSSRPSLCTRTVRQSSMYSATR